MKSAPHPLIPSPRVHSLIQSSALKEIGTLVQVLKNEEDRERGEQRKESTAVLCFSRAPWIVSLSAKNLELCGVPPSLGVKKPSLIPAWLTCGHHCPNPSHCTYHKASSLVSKSPGIGFLPQAPWTPTTPCLKCNSIS